METDSNYLNWEGPYLSVLPLDPWDHNYFFDTDYTIDGQPQAVVGSYGPNGEGLNDYDDDDIIIQLTK
ncbi:MAG: type II secretion system protein GspG [Patescibacteria group bacterium]